MTADLMIEEQDAACVAAKPVCLSVEEFVAQVIYDGRFLDTFTVEPQGVAELLGIEIVPDIVKDIRDRDPVQVLAETTARMTSEYGQRDVIGIGLPDVHADFGISATVVVGAIAIAIIVCVVVDHTPVVTDDSPNADLKL
jgi:hypothetical protein